MYLSSFCSCPVNLVNLVYVIHPQMSSRPQTVKRLPLYAYNGRPSVSWSCAVAPLSGVNHHLSCQIKPNLCLGENLPCTQSDETLHAQPIKPSQHGNTRQLSPTCFVLFFPNAVCKKWNSWLGSNRGTKAQTLHREAPAITGEPTLVWSDRCRRKKSEPFVLYTTNGAISPPPEKVIFQLLKYSRESSG